MSASTVLEVEDLTVRYGQVTALEDVSLTVGAGEVVAVIGPNGAGKTTLLRAISGLVSSSGGRVVLDGQDLRSVAPHKIARSGCVHVPEGRGTIAPLTVEENLRVAGARLPRGRLGARIDELYELFAVLGRLRARRAGLLSGGEQQMLAIARGVLMDPKVLVIDEPSIGLAPRVVVELLEMLRTITGAGTALLLVEQNSILAGELADRLHLLVRGRTRASGAAADMPADLMAEFIG